MEADQVLSWNELRGRNYGVAGRAVSGTVRATVPGGGREPEVLRFWHAPPERWQVEDGQGVRQVFGPGGRFVRGDGGRMRRLSPNVSVGFEQGHPFQLVVAHRRWPVEDPHAQAVAPVSWPPAAVQRSGRAAWEVVLQGPEIPQVGTLPPLRAVFDDATGMVVELETQGTLIELLDFTLDPPLPEGQFGWGGPFEQDPDPVAEHDERRRRIEQVPVPAPGWWPGGPRVAVAHADPDPGASVLELHVEGGARLARWPHHVAEPNTVGAGRDWRFHHAWDDAHWRWRLRSGRVLDEGELARFVASLPEHTPPPRRLGPGPDPTGGRGRVVVFDGVVDVDYGQFALASGTGPGGDLQAGFLGQANGLCGTAVDGAAHLLTGTYWGQVPLVVELADHAPQVEDGWEEVVEAPLVVVGGKGLALAPMWGTGQAPVFPLAAGSYRLRYHLRGMDDARLNDGRPGPGAPTFDAAKILIWPAAPAPDAVVKQTSGQAASWHDAWNTRP